MVRGGSDLDDYLNITNSTVNGDGDDDKDSSNSYIVFIALSH